MTWLLNCYIGKESIILTVIDIINELGIQGLSTRELAKRQEISEGTLFRHFKTKNHIILAVLDYFSKYDADIFHSVKLKKLKPKEAITFFVDSYATYYENYPAITVMTQIYSVLSYEAELAPKITSILGGPQKLSQTDHRRRATHRGNPERCRQRNVGGHHYRHLRCYLPYVAGCVPIISRYEPKRSQP